jgi:transmembrane sensor
LTEADRAALNAWLAADARHAGVLAQYGEFSRLLDRGLPILVADGALTAPARPVPARVRPYRLPLLLAGLGAAAVLALMLVARGHGRPATFATRAGERQTVTLADGTQVELNARTVLLVEPMGDERRVRLSDGEAFFRVAKDRAHPFIVNTAAGSVRVTGTVFDVRALTPKNLDVTVVEGSVQVQPPPVHPADADLPVLLSAGERFSTEVSPRMARRLSPEALDDCLAWRDGHVVFTGTPLREALAQFARYHGRSIAVDPDVADLRVGGRFNLDDLDGFLGSLGEAWPLRIHRDSAGGIQVSRRLQP